MGLFGKKKGGRTEHSNGGSTSANTSKGNDIRIPPPLLHRTRDGGVVPYERNESPNSTNEQFVTAQRSESDFEVQPAREKAGVDETVRQIITKYRKAWTEIGFSRSVTHFGRFRAEGEQKSKDGLYKEAYSDYELCLSVIEPFLIHWKMDNWLLRQTEERVNLLMKHKNDDPEVNIEQDYFYGKLIHKYKRLIWADDLIEEFEEIPVKSIVPINFLLDYSKVMGHVGQLKNLEGLIRYFPDLERLYGEEIKKANADLKIGKSIRKHVKDSPGAIQSKLKQELGIDDGRAISNLCSKMEKYGLMVREKDGKEHRLKLTY